MSAAILYLRYSPRKTDLCESLEVQESHIRQYLSFAGIEPGLVLRDPETSARLTPLAKREGGAKLLSLTTGRNPEFKIVAAYRLDRLFRSVVDGCQTLEAWRDAGVAVHFSAEGGQSLNTATATGRFLVNILLSKAAYEPDLTAERTSDAMKRHSDSGRYMGYLPYGKREGESIEVNGRLVRTIEDDPEEQSVIQMATKFYNNGCEKNYSAVARKLNGLGVPCRNSRGWSATQVKRVLGRQV